MEYVPLTRTEPSTFWCQADTLTTEHIGQACPLLKTNQYAFHIRPIHSSFHLPYAQVGGIPCMGVNSTNGLLMCHGEEEGTEPDPT